MSKGEPRVLAADGRPPRAPRARLAGLLGRRRRVLGDPPAGHGHDGRRRRWPGKPGAGRRGTSRRRRRRTFRCERRRRHRWRETRRSSLTRSAAAASGDGAAPAGFWDTSNIPQAKNVMTFKFLNRTNGKYADSEVYWSFKNGAISETHSIAEQPTYDMPANASGRMYFYLCGVLGHDVRERSDPIQVLRFHRAHDRRASVQRQHDPRGRLRPQDRDAPALFGRVRYGGRRGLRDLPGRPRRDVPEVPRRRASGVQGARAAALTLRTASFSPARPGSTKGAPTRPTTTPSSIRSGPPTASRSPNPGQTAADSGRIPTFRLRSTGTWAPSPGRSTRAASC